LSSERNNLDVGLCVVVVIVIFVVVGNSVRNACDVSRILCVFATNANRLLLLLLMLLLLIGLETTKASAGASDVDADAMAHKTTVADSAGIAAIRAVDLDAVLDCSRFRNAVVFRLRRRTAEVAVLFAIGIVVVVNVLYR